MGPQEEGQQGGQEGGREGRADKWGGVREGKTTTLIGYVSEHGEYEEGSTEVWGGGRKRGGDPFWIV